MAIEDLLLDQHDFLDEVVIIVINLVNHNLFFALAENAEMDWSAWWASIVDLPFLNEPILMAYDEIPRTATMKVQTISS